MPRYSESGMTLSEGELTLSVNYVLFISSASLCLLRCLFYGFSDDFSFLQRDAGFYRQSFVSANEQPIGDALGPIRGQRSAGGMLHCAVNVL